MHREKETHKQPHREADLFLCLPHLNPYSLKEKKTRDSFSCCLHSGDNGDAISSVNSNASGGEAQTGGPDMQLKEESPYLFLCPLKCHLSFLHLSSIHTSLLASSKVRGWVTFQFVYPARIRVFSKIAFDLFLSLSALCRELAHSHRFSAAFCAGYFQIFSSSSDPMGHLGHQHCISCCFEPFLPGCAPPHGAPFNQPVLPSIIPHVSRG